MNLFHQLFDEILLENALWQSNQTDSDSEFEKHLHQMYEFEYKLNAIKEWSFNGMPQRFANIRNGLTTELINSTEFVKGILLQTFANWLKEHAILNPAQWGEARVDGWREQDTEAEGILGDILYTYWDYERKLGYVPPERNTYHFFDKPENKNKLFRELMNKITSDITNYPEFEAFFKETALPAQREMDQERFDYEPEEYKQSYGFKTDEEAQNHIDNLSLSDIDLSSSYIGDTAEDFTANVPEYQIVPLLAEMYEKLVFPLWMQYWEPQGIVETRENIENIYKQLQASNASKLGNMISWTNAALNASHQTGSMLDYVERISGSDNLKSVLDGLTEGSYTDTWNEELNEHGFYPEKKHSLKPKIQKLVQ